MGRSSSFFFRVPLFRVPLFRVLTCSALVVASVAVTAGTAAAAATHDNEVYAFGSASFRGSTDGFPLSRPIVAMASTADGSGYWLVASDGGIFAFNAPFYGALTGWPLSQPVTGMTATPSGKGYWLVTGNGSVFPFGDAKSYGDLTGVPLNAPIKSLIPGPGGKGYWLYASDGGIFSFGDAIFRGSTGSMRLNAPVVGMARDGSGNGYWLAGADGGVFTFGDAHFKGSASGLVPSDRHVVQLVGMPDGNGYRMLSLRDQPDVGLVGMGATGAAVVDIQNRLTSLGYWLPGVNGVFDANMQQAVWAFQKANGLPRTGVVDPATQAKFRTAGRPNARSTTGTMIEIDKARQILMVVTNGYVRYTFNASTGSDHPYVLDGVGYSAHTPEGVYSVIREVNGPDHGPLGTLYRPKYFTWSGIAVHGYTSVPPYPASHGCTRVSNAAIDWIWANNILPIGMSVWVY